MRLTKAAHLAQLARQTAAATDNRALARLVVAPFHVPSLRCVGPRDALEDMEAALAREVEPLVCRLDVIIDVDATVVDIFGDFAMDELWDAEREEAYWDLPEEKRPQVDDMLWC